MANHANVKTKLKMTAEDITGVIDRLNKSLFKNGLKADYHKGTKGGPEYGPHTWVLKYGDYMTRICWLTNPTKFGMRHGGGTNFAWWIDNAIVNEVALQFDGIITDDAVSEKWKGVPNKYDDFHKFLAMMFDHVKNKDVIQRLQQAEMELTPPEFRVYHEEPRNP